jgi:hypothetical protein
MAAPEMGGFLFLAPDARQTLRSQEMDRNGNNTDKDNPQYQQTAREKP